MPSKHKTNLCKQVPEVPTTCTTQHGMLICLGGRKASSLYANYVLRHRDELVSKVGAGLFLHGGNPIYHMAKGTADDVANEVHAVLRSHMDDLGRHHIVLKILEGSEYMPPEGFNR